MILEIAEGRVISLTDGHMPHFFVGLDANKPANPGVSDVFIATDTNKEYICYTANVWSLISSPCVEKYSNHLGTDDNIMSSGSSGNATQTTTSHQKDLSTGVGSAGVAYWKPDITINPATQFFKLQAKVKGIVNGAGVDRHSHVGVVTSISTDVNPQEGCYFHQDESDNWSAVTNITAVGTESTGVTVVNGDTLTILGQKSRILFFVNGVLVANHTNFIPSATKYPGANVVATAATVGTARQLSIDYIDIEVIT